jgi:hypothetical protein
MTCYCADVDQSIGIHLMSFFLSMFSHFCLVMIKLFLLGSYCKQIPPLLSESTPEEKTEGMFEDSFEGDLEEGSGGDKV